MELQECYAMMGANFDEVKRRLRKETLIERILLMLPKDNNYDLLLQSLEEKDYHTAFRAIHSLKGISMNLGLTSLIESSSLLTEILREEKDSLEIPPLLEKLKKDYQVAINAVTAYMQSNNIEGR